MNGSDVADSIGCIAVIGMAGRFPGASSLDHFWLNLVSGVESIGRLSDEELLESGVPLAEINRPNYVKAKAILEGVDLFDASFFNFNPREAEIMDPQLRIFLECAYEALENAGYDSERYKGRIGVFAGAATNTYHENLRSSPDLINMVGTFQAVIINDKDFVPTWTSYKLNLRGPSVNIQTACSTSLVAAHMAYQSLINGECDMALAGGVSITFPQRAGYIYDEGGLHSPDGHCRPFDAKAKGFVEGEGIGIVVLKRLDRALEDRDSIRAIIRASSINNDGSAKVGYTAPSLNGLAEVVAESIEMAGIDPETISYVEANGTGTPLGDPIEIAALTQAFQAKTSKKNFCGVGSLKSNIGHLNTAAGIAALIKTVLALENKTLPPCLNFEQPNPAINFADSPFYVSKEPLEWKANGSPRRAAVNSYGIGGTNVHVIAEEAPATAPPGKSRPYQLLLLSGKTGNALERVTANLISHTRARPELNLADVAFTLQTGRRVFNHRRMLVCRDLNEAAIALEICDEAKVFTRFDETEDRQIAFIFPGTGAQYVNMGVELYHEERVFRQEVDNCSEILCPLLGLDLRDVLYPDGARTEKALERLKQTSLAIASTFVIEYALARLWMSWGICPHVMLGESFGEYPAACLAGALSLEDALSLAVYVGKLLEQLLLGAQHSQTATPVAAALRQFLQKVEPRSLTIPLISSSMARRIDPGDTIGPDYWLRHLLNPVRLDDAFECLLNEPALVMIEAGPGLRLTTLAKEKQKSNNQIALPSIGACAAQASEFETLLTTLGQLWLAGVRVDWGGFYREERRARVVLPSYPFERQRYWVGRQSERSSFTGECVVSQEPRAPLSYYRPDLSSEYAPPCNDVQWVVALILKDYLGLERVGINDNFFDLGGQSLLATRIVSALRETFQIDIPLRMLFERPTVAGMSEAIEAAAREWDVDVHRVARLVRQIDVLPDEEVKKMLALNQT